MLSPNAVWLEPIVSSSDYSVDALVRRGLGYDVLRTLNLRRHDVESAFDADGIHRDCTGLRLDSRARLGVANVAGPGEPPMSRVGRPDVEKGIVDRIARPQAVSVLPVLVRSGVTLAIVLVAAAPKVRHWIMPGPRRNDV